MARFDMTGFDELLAEMKQLGELSGAVADKMLLAGAEEVKQAWKESAERQNLKDTTDMINSIGYPKSPKTTGDIRQIDIYPQGKDRKGVRNATKAFVLNYGTKGSTSKRAQKRRTKVDKRPGPGIPATHWVDDADTASGPLVIAAMERIWDEHLKGNT